MSKEYDFSKGKRNPYAKQLKQSITMRVDRTTLGYFKALAAELAAKGSTQSTSLVLIQPRIMAMLRP